jgi:PAS domain S-box-containing protein
VGPRSSIVNIVTLPLSILWKPATLVSFNKRTPPSPAGNGPLPSSARGANTPFFFQRKCERMDTSEAPHIQGFPLFEKSISQTAREQLLLLDANLSVQAASKSFYAAFQVAPGHTVGKKLADLCDGQWNIPALLTRLRELPKLNGEFDDIELEHDFPVLGGRTLLVSARRLSADDAQGGMILLFIRDTSGQKRAEPEIGAFLTLSRTILDSIGDAVIVTDPESRITFMNAAAEKLTGWTQNNALQKNLSDIFQIVGEQSSQAVENPVARAIREGAVVGLANHTILIARDGSEWPIDDSAAPILDAGRLVGVVLVFHDVTNRRKTEQNLEVSAVRYRRLFESAHDGILILDAVTGKVLDANPFIGGLLGYPREHFLGKELWEIGVFQDAEMSKSAMATLQKVGRIRYEDLPLQHKDGRHIPVEFVSNVYREGRQNVIQCNIRDITERKRLSQDLAKAMLDAETANRSKSEFLANMSHEIRTPMSAILGFADMLLHKSPEECAQAGCVQVIRRNSLHLLELINEILDLSKIEAGQMRVERISCDLPALLSELISLMSPRAAEKGLGFGVIFQGGIPRLIKSDPLRLRQILVNLLGNAVKFTESGRIDLRVADEGADGPNIVLRVDVIDSGIGMSPEQLARLFLPFTQGDASITRKFGGTGLGLTISRRLAKLLRGDVTAISQPNIGSVFTLKVDGGPSAGVERLQGLTEATLPATADQGVRAAIHLRGRILLVEDGADNQRLLRMQLGNAGASVTSALDGQIAVDLANRHAFDLILMDMQMPVMDGYAATIELRRRGLTIPIIALTAYAMAEDREKCIASGCNAYLSKPIEEETLLRTVREYLESDHSLEPIESTKAGSAGSPPSAGEADGSKRIMSSLAGDVRIMRILPEFVDGLPGKVLKIIDLLERNDLPALHLVAHQLLGTCGGYGFDAVSQPARSVEQSIIAGEDVESIKAAVKSLVEVIRRIDGYDESKAPVAAWDPAK